MAAGRSSAAPHSEELVVRSHRSQMSETVRHSEETGNRADIPYVVVAEAVVAAKLMIRPIEVLGSSCQFDSESDHRFLSFVYVRFGWVDSELIRNQWIWL